MKPSPSIGVCVLNWNSGEGLSRCIESLYDIDHTLVIVDNASTDGSCRTACERFPDIPVIVNPSKSGHAAGLGHIASLRAAAGVNAAGNNIGAAYLLAAGCEVLTFVNANVAISASALKDLVETLWRDPQVGCAGGSPLTPPGPAGFEVRSMRHVFRERFVDSDGLPDGCEVFAVCGACTAFRAQAFQQIGGFDENTSLDAEEFTVAERLRRKGWSVRLSKSAACLHGEAASPHGKSAGRMRYQHKLHSRASEIALLRRYYRWNAGWCLMLWLYRSAELIAGVPLWLLRRNWSSTALHPDLELSEAAARPKALRP